MFLATIRQFFCQKVIQPVGKTPVETAWKRSTLARFDVLQVFNTQDAHGAEADLLQRLSNKAFDMSVGMFLALGKTLDHIVGRSTGRLAIREHQMAWAPVRL
jgi:hypothetical protein